ncbi:MAG: DUF5683 domain-containing protein [Bacteroidales bacterium]|nr:DUF5683 domain-containing protein [Bacteroidales bacterium]
MNNTVNNLTTRILTLLLVLACFSAPLFAQQAEDEVVVADTAPLSRMSMFPQKTAAINQSFERFFNGHDPKIATYLGFVPGLGQVYNKKYWKLPIVYAGFAVTGYFAISNRNEYRLFANAYSCKLAEDPDDPSTICDNPLAQKYTVDGLRENRDYYRRNMELSYIIMGVWYILQILDATVDAHLYDWEVNEDLKVSVQPVFRPLLRPAFGNTAGPSSAGINGISVSLKF